MDGTQPYISVVMPVFNGTRFLDRSVRSVLSQSFHDWELVAVDDCSADGSYESLCCYAASDSRVRPLRLATNSGPSAARNLALRHCRDQMIAYLDCDDEYYPGYLDWVHRCRSKADVLVFAYDAVDDDGVLLRPGEVRTWNPAMVRSILLHRNVACPLGVAHRRDLLEKVGLFDETISILEDWDLWRRFALTGAEFVYLPIKSGLYHIRGDSLSRTERVPEAIKAMAGLGSDQHPIDAAQDEKQVQHTDALPGPIWVG
jgi:glycosyltransferase involved in cell wall biosynthesis